MRDVAFEGFLERQRERAAEWNRETTLVEVRPRSDRSFDLLYRCLGVIADPEHRRVMVATPGAWRDPWSGEAYDGFVARIDFRDDHLRRVDPFRLITWVGPIFVVHPNINGLFGKACIGPVAPSTGLEELIYRLWEVITFRNVNTNENDCLNPEVCGWARAQRARFPVDDRPLRDLASFAVREIGVDPS
ncbi:MAG: hypothetical protein KDC38_05410 [Planctomycetes bacterium]|nr:hypothetical protein [Planctomycetota bacterium]